MRNKGQKSRLTRLITLVMVTLFLLVAFGFYFSSLGKLTDYLINVVTNVMFLVFTYTFLKDLTNQQQLQAEIRDLLNRVEQGNVENSYEAFIEIVEAIKRGKYPFDTLRGKYYRNAKLTGIHLESYHLENADLTKADLEKAKLIGIYFQNANLEEANLRDANLTLAHLEGANLSGADLRGTILNHAIFNHDSKLKSAMFNTNTKFNGDTILPNGSRYKLDETDEMRAYLERELGMIWYP